jgi:hypothetical protein
MSVKLCYKYSHEEMFHGSFDSVVDSIEDVMDDAKFNYYGDDGIGDEITVEIGEIVDPLTYLESADYIAENLIESINECLFDYIPCDDDVMELDKEDVSALHKMIIEFIKEKGTFNAYGVENVIERTFILTE